MATVTLQGNQINTNGTLPNVGENISNTTLVKQDLSRASINDFKGQKLVLNIFPSVDTGTCAASVRKFNEEASKLENTKVLCISKDLPFAQGRFCGAEGIENVEMLSDFEAGEFAKANGVEFVDGPLKGLIARSIIVLDENGTVKHTELVPETVDEPNYQAALAAL